MSEPQFTYEMAELLHSGVKDQLRAANEQIVKLSLEVSELRRDKEELLLICHPALLPVGSHESQILQLTRRLRECQEERDRQEKLHLESDKEVMRLRGMIKDYEGRIDTLKRAISGE